MARRYRSRSRRTYSGSAYHGYQRSIGHERALEHIREAEELSKELGGTDRDVKAYFFSLPPAKLRNILDQYEREYGHSKREYAEIALPQWRSGRKKMSGLVAGRLYSMLPPRMPIDTKYSLVENLWEVYSPKSHKVLTVGPDAQTEDVVEAMQSHVMNTVKHYTIPEPLERRFNWLSMGDVQVKQKLLNYLLDLEKQRAVVGARQQVPVMLRHLREHGSITHRLAHTIEIGKHKFELQYVSAATGIRISDPRPYSSSMSRPSTERSYAWVWWLVAAAVLYWIFAA